MKKTLKYVIIYIINVRGETMELRNLGITTSKINQFNSKGIYTVEDLINFFPRKYLDFRRPVSLY